jgi:protein TonB
MPTGRDDWRMGSIVSVLAHLGIILLFFTPVMIMSDVREIAQGAGGPGPAGGGGGGSRGDRLRAELIRFVQVVSTPPPVLPKVEVKPPVPVPVPPPIPPPELPNPTLTPGTNAAAGQENTTGSGPGTGGGTGTGVGTGTGSSVGPGTGGGNQVNHPPTPIEMFIPPLPVPQSVKGFHLIAEFDVDERGRVLSLTFTETRDRGYNRRLGDVLKGFRFRPGTRPDGTPVRMKAQVVVDLY